MIAIVIIGTAIILYSPIQVIVAVGKQDYFNYVETSAASPNWPSRFLVFIFESKPQFVGFLLLSTSIWLLLPIWLIPLLLEGSLYYSAIGYILWGFVIGAGLNISEVIGLALRTYYLRRKQEIP